MAASTPIHVLETDDPQELADTHDMCRDAVVSMAARGYGVARDRLGVFEHYFGVVPTWFPREPPMVEMANESYARGLRLYVADVELLPLAKADPTEGGTRGTWGKRLPTSPTGPARLTKLADR